MKKGILILLIGILVFGFKLVSAANCGGAIQCNCGDTVVESYNMSSDLTNCTDNGLIISVNNITLDCQGHLIDGDGAGVDYGIYLDNKDNVVIRNCNVSKFGYGIYLDKSSNNNLINNTANYNNEFGIRLYYSSNNILSDNIANYNKKEGIQLYYSSNNTLSGNTANNNDKYGIQLYGGSHNHILNNNAKENSNFDIYIDAGSDSDCNNIIESNNISGNRPLKYFNYSVNLENEILSELILCNANNSNINNVTIIGSETLKNNGVLVINTNNSNFTNINSSNNYYGIYLLGSSSNNLIGNTAHHNHYGIYLSSHKMRGRILFDTSNNTLFGNTVNYNSRGIYLDESPSNVLSDNVVNNNVVGIDLSKSPNNTLSDNIANNNSWDGIYLHLSSNNNVLSENTANNNGLDGISLSYSFYNNLTDNTVSNNNLNGIDLDESPYNTFFGNIVSNNDYGIYLAFSSYSNIISNTANNNSIYGISLSYSSYNNLTDNTANNNKYGIYLFESSNSTLINNAANYNNQNGIYLSKTSRPMPGRPYGSNNNTLFSNTANNNDKYGILLHGSSHNTLLSNTANNNQKHGLYVDNPSNNNTINSNTFCSNNQSGGNYFDVYDADTNSGDLNTCDSVYNWNDDGTTGCTYSCALTTPLAIPLLENWNLVSISLVLENDSIEYVFGNIMDKVIVINSFESGSGGAKTYDPELPEFSDLHDINYLHGYWVKMNQSADLIVNGTIPEDKTIILDENWNLISYLCDTNKSVEDIFVGVMDKVIVINGFENGALTYDPQLPEFSDLQIMKPNYGYWVKMNQSAVLNYNGVC